MTDNFIPTQENKDLMAKALELGLQGKHDEAEQLYINAGFEHPGRTFNLGWHAIRHGKLKEGFQMMDAGRFINCYGLPAIQGKIWRNEPLQDKVVTFRCEGGYGDQVMFLRFARDLQAMGARVVVACAKEIAPLFSLNGFTCIDNEFAHGIMHDYWIPAMSSAHMLDYEYPKLKEASLKPYLKAGTREIYVEDKSLLKVGIRWSGRPEFEHEQHRRFDPSKMFDLRHIPGVALYALQRDDNTIDGLPFADMRPAMKTWVDTAEIVNSLDLVITSCTSIAHLAGALGKEVWVIVPALPYYCWAIPGDKTDWYPTARLFRQKTYGNWDDPLNEIHAALEEKVKLQKPEILRIENVAVLSD